MKFEDALKAMRVRCLSLSSNTFELEPWTKRFFVNDGMNLLPIYGIKDEYLLADDWEICGMSIFKRW